MKGITISSQIIEVLNFLCEKFGIVIDWSSDNVMPYIQTLCEKYITWEINTSIFWLVFGVIFIISGIILIICDWKLCWYVGPTVFGVIFIIIGISMLCVQILDIIKCNTFPELQLVEYVKSFISVNTN